MNRKTEEERKLKDEMEKQNGKRERRAGQIECRWKEFVKKEERNNR
jgi:hypothetical protein